MRCVVCDYTGNKNQEQSHFHRSLKIRHKGLNVQVVYYPDLNDYYCLECAGSILSSLKQEKKEDK